MIFFGNDAAESGRRRILPRSDGPAMTANAGKCDAGRWGFSGRDVGRDGVNRDCRVSDCRVRGVRRAARGNPGFGLSASGGIGQSRLSQQGGGSAETRVRIRATGWRSRLRGGCTRLRGRWPPRGVSGPPPRPRERSRSASPAGFACHFSKHPSRLIKRLEWYQRRRRRWVKIP